MFSNPTEQRRVRIHVSETRCREGRNVSLLEAKKTALIRCLYSVCIVSPEI